MLKNILRTVFALIFFSCTAHASFTAPYPKDWTHIRTLGDYKVYHKETYTNLVNVGGEKRLNTWAKYVARDTKPNLFQMRKDDYVLVQLQFICSTRQYAIISGTTYFSKGGQPRASVVDEPQFTRIQSNSIESRIANRVCSQQYRA